MADLLRLSLLATLAAHEAFIPMTALIGQLLLYHLRFGRERLVETARTLCRQEPIQVMWSEHHLTAAFPGQYQLCPPLQCFGVTQPMAMVYGY
jgi:hypothetical protein